MQHALHDRDSGESLETIGQQLREEGYAVVPQLLSSAEVDALEEVEAARWPLSPRTLRPAPCSQSGLGSPPAAVKARRGTGRHGR